MKKSLSDGHKWLVNASVRTVIFFFWGGGGGGEGVQISNTEST